VFSFSRNWATSGNNNSWSGRCSKSARTICWLREMTRSFTVVCSAGSRTNAQ
ncbi:DUF3788 family protein, partial [Paraburkholderia caledonica]|uniref:DUF3788 family protein n=1 Tax=Paraburkholderia caledonica TaxID=134536 RepID=UPI003CC6D8A9